MQPSPDHKQFDQAQLERLRAALDASADALDAATLTRLHTARRAALARAGQRHGWRLWSAPPNGWLLPASGFASLAVVALTATLTIGQPDRTPRSALDEIELLSSKADLELLDELDFYAWLPSSEGHG